MCVKPHKHILNKLLFEFCLKNTINLDFEGKTVLGLGSSEAADSVISVLSLPEADYSF